MAFRSTGLSKAVGKRYSDALLTSALALAGGEYLEKSVSVLKMPYVRKSSFRGAPCSRSPRELVLCSCPALPAASLLCAVSWIPNPEEGSEITSATCFLIYMCDVLCAPRCNAANPSLLHTFRIPRKASVTSLPSTTAPCGLWSLSHADTTAHVLLLRISFPLYGPL